MAASEREAALLARVAANHLFLAQFEALRAALLSLRRRADPGLAADFLRAVVAAGGRVPGVLWSAPPACPSPSHLAWLAALELAALSSTPNPEALRLKAEFLILLQPIADDPAVGAESRGGAVPREGEGCRVAAAARRSGGGRSSRRIVRGVDLPRVVGDNEFCVDEATTVRDANSYMHLAFWLVLLESVLT